ncbi:MAG TPA: glycosyltransferase family 4 protein [Candidatus Methylomirabilis sp.]|nr:glycosyltransferase family 4 protein [Candidatus Methylomirabilis sp.]
MRILFLIAQFHPIVGGAERHAQTLARGLIHRGHEVVVVTRWRKGWAQRETIDGVPIRRGIWTLDFGLLYPLTYAASVMRALLQHRNWADVIHVTNIYLEAFVAIAMRRWHGIPVVVRPACAGYYGDLARLERFRVWPVYPGPARISSRKFVRLIARADAFVANSQELRGELVGAGFPADRVLQIPNGVDVDRFRPASDVADVRTALNLPPGPLVVCIGRLDPQKGLDTLLTAVEPLLRRTPGLRVLLLGDGPLRGDLEARIRRAELADRILLNGVVADVAPYLRSADVFVLPSVGEGMPNALLEAMASGLPCVASAIGGCRDVIRDGRTGLLVPPGNAVALREALEQLLQSQALADRMGAAAREDVVARFGLERMLDRYEACYRAVKEGRPSASDVADGSDAWP